MLADPGVPWLPTLTPSQNFHLLLFTARILPLERCGCAFIAGHTHSAARCTVHLSYVTCTY
jgi:hypothetical protein